MKKGHQPGVCCDTQDNEILMNWRKSQPTSLLVGFWSQAALGTQISPLLICWLSDSTSLPFPSPSVKWGHASCLRGRLVH